MWLVTLAESVNDSYLNLTSLPNMLLIIHLPAFLHPCLKESATCLGLRLNTGSVHQRGSDHDWVENFTWRQLSHLCSPVNRVGLQKMEWCLLPSCMCSSMINCWESVVRLTHGRLQSSSPPMSGLCASIKSQLKQKGIFLLIWYIYHLSRSLLPSFKFHQSNCLISANAPSR